MILLVVLEWKVLMHIEKDAGKTGREPYHIRGPLQNPSNREAISLTTARFLNWSLDRIIYIFLAVVVLNSLID